nr:DNA repair protein RadA [Chitinophagales bacterium]
LSGEGRSVARIELRIAEADKLGFKTIYVPAANKGYEIGKKLKIRILPVRTVGDVYNQLFG